MAAFTTIALAVGLAVSAVGVGLQAYGQNQMAEAQEDAEKSRKKQMQLDTIRRRRQAIREMMQARALSLSNATNATGGAETSGMLGGMFQAQGVASRSITDLNQNLALGTDIFTANARAAQAEGLAYTGSGLKDFGGMLMSNNVNIDKLGNRVGLWS
jgi:hypothetical protein